jgi:putative membrane protein
MNKLKILPHGVLALIATAFPLTVIAQTNSAPTDPSNNSENSGALVNSTGSKPRTGGAETGMSIADKKFVRDAAQGGLAEVELGQLATERASSDDVKKFGERMVDDHTKAGEELKGIATSHGVPVPQRLSTKDQMTVDHLSKLKGPQFDKEYMADMVKDHTKDVADFQRESNSGMDSDVKGFASQTLPTLQDHLRQAKEIARTTSDTRNTQTMPQQ